MEIYFPEEMDLHEDQKNGLNKNGSFFGPDGKVPLRVAEKVKVKESMFTLSPRLMLWARRKEKTSALRKRRKDPDAERRGKAKNVKT